MLRPRRFPPPWTIDEQTRPASSSANNTGQALGYFYFEDEPGRRSAAKAAHQGRGAADGGELREVAGAVS
jgi:hypothetical protein